MSKLSDEEIRKRMVEWRNYKNILHPKLKERSDRLETKVKTLERENARLEQKLKSEHEEMEKIKLQLEELRAMKFGKKRHKNLKGNLLPSSSQDSEEESKDKEIKKQRSPESYRRPLPSPDRITDRLHLEINTCPTCGKELTDKKKHVHYREDLKEVEKLLEAAQKIVETTIESGKCETCKFRHFAMEVPGQNVILGENIRQMIVYLSVVMGHSYSEVAQALRHQYGMKISSGQITNILEGESRLLTPYYNFLIQSLDEESRLHGAHYDETTWKTQSKGEEITEGNYCWIKIGVKSQNRLIWFGKSRGKGVAESLRGEKKGSIGVSDDYGSYKHLFDHHGLCWAHPHRKLRDLAQSTVLTGSSKKICERTFKAFAILYKKAEKVRKKLLSENLNDSQKAQERLTLEKQFAELCISTKHDVQQLKNIRDRLRERRNRYFTFLDHPQLPLDNNKAERAIRKIVLKRKKSLGSQSQKGADTLSILYSVVLSLTSSEPEKSFFELYPKAAEFEELKGGQ